MKRTKPLQTYGLAITLTFIAYLLTELLWDFIDRTPSIFFFVAITLTAWHGGIKPGLVSSVLSTGFVVHNDLYLNSDSSLIKTAIHLIIFNLVAIGMYGLAADLHRSQTLLRTNNDRLREQEALLRLFIRYAPVGIAMFDQQMRYVAASKHWVDEYHLESIESILGRSHYDIFPEIPDAWKQVHQRCLGGAIEKCSEDLFLREDGSQQWVFWEVHPWYQSDHQVGGIIIFSLDISDRKNVEIALQKSQQQIQRQLAEIESIYQSAPVGLNVLDRELRFVRINQRLADINGLPIEAHLGRTIREVLPDLADIAETLLNPILKTGEPLFNVEITGETPAQPGVKRVWLESFLPLKQEDQIIGISTVCEEITERKATEKALQTAKVDLENRVIERTTALQRSNDRLQQETNQKQLLWNITQNIRQSLNLLEILTTAAAEVRQSLQVDRVAFYNFNPDWSGEFIVESVGEDWVKLVNSDVKLVWKDTYLQQHKGGRFRNHEIFIVNNIYTANLEFCHIDLLEQFQALAYVAVPIFVGTTLWGLLAIYQNSHPRNWQDQEVELLQQICNQLAIAIQQSQLYNQLQLELQERQQAEAKIRESERRWRSLLQNVKLLVVGLDQFGTIDYVNPFFLEVTGYTYNELIGKSWFDTVRSDSLSMESSSIDARFILKTLLTDHVISHAQNFILTKTGEQRLISWNNTLLKNSEEDIVGSISIGQDITERQKLEDIKNEFIGIVSHELRTPLTAIQMSLSLLNMGLYKKNPEKSQRMIEIALTDTKRLVNLVNDILDLERLESGRVTLEKTDCSALALMEQAAETMRTIAHQQNISIAIMPTEFTVWAASDSIIQTLANLLSNALKFSPPHSTICLQAHSNLDEILFQVQDQGRGIPEDKLETIFGRFQQVDASDAREKGGTGLGLSICRSIIERHGGKIWAESILGQGSTFYFTLPRSKV